jgi:hypothetical protein
LERSAIDWVCVRRRAWRGDSQWCRLLYRVLTRLSGATSRVRVQRWVRFRLDPADVPLPESGIRLTPVSEQLLTALRAHPDHADEGFASGLEFWDFGVRDGFVWCEDGQLRCFQWQLSNADTAALRARSPWGDMYPPLAPGTAHQEKMWTFSSSRMKGVASRFALAMFDEARRAGVTTLIAHISETNSAALALVNRTGWKPYGKIERFYVDFPVFSSLNVSVAMHVR